MKTAIASLSFFIVVLAALHFSLRQHVVALQSLVFTLSEGQHTLIAATGTLSTDQVRILQIVKTNIETMNKHLAIMDMLTARLSDVEQRLHTTWPGTFGGDVILVPVADNAGR